MRSRKILVLGIGNLLMGDEGIGVHAIRRLEQETLPAHVTLVDGGLSTKLGEGLCLGYNGNTTF